MRFGLAALSGVLLGISFPKFGLSLVSLVALVPLLWALQQPGTGTLTLPSRKTAFRLGYVAGAAFFLVLLHWIPRLPRENVTIPFAMYPILVIIVAYLSLFPAMTALGSVLLARRGVPVGLTFPLLWTVLEVLRSSGVFGFPWGALGYCMASYPHLIQFAEFTGLWGVTLWIVMVNGLVHQYLASRWIKPKAFALGALLVLALGPYLHGKQALGAREPRPGVEVGLIQPNVGGNKWLLAVRDSVIHSLLNQTEAFARVQATRKPDLLVWPETAVPARLPRNEMYRRQVEALVDSIDIPVLAGFPDGYLQEDGKARYTNSAALLIPERGLVEQYDKRHLVPFSEFFPLPLLNRFDFGQADFSAGKIPGVMRELEYPFGVLICFESIFPGPARDLRLEGARYLVNITNDQWFGDSAAPYQHFNMNILRCIENRVGMVRAANTGISGAIDSYGMVTQKTATFTTTAILSKVELGRREFTLYTRFGDWIVVICGVVLLGMTSWAVLRGTR